MQHRFLLMLVYVIDILVQICIIVMQVKRTLDNAALGIFMKLALPVWTPTFLISFAVCQSHYVVDPWVIQIPPPGLHCDCASTTGCIDI